MKEKEGERKNMCEDPHHETTSNLHIYIFSTSAEEAPIHAYTNTDEYARLIYSALFSTASRHGSLFLATIVLFTSRGFLINIISRFREKKSFTFAFIYYASQ